jgi:hypothetical protein
MRVRVPAPSQWSGDEAGINFLPSRTRLIDPALDTQ